MLNGLQLARTFLACLPLDNIQSVFRSGTCEGALVGSVTVQQPGVGYDSNQPGIFPLMAPHVAPSLSQLPLSFASIQVTTPAAVAMLVALA